jgi:dihydrofolate reductase
MKGSKNDPELKEKTMRKLVISEFISLDGVIQAPGGEDEDTDGGFKQGAWTIPYWHDDIGVHFDEVMQNCDTMLLGRKTWQTHGEAFDPMPAGDPFFDRMNGLKKYVVSTTLKDTNLWRNSTLISENVVEEVRALKAQEGKHIALDGSSVLAHTLIENDLVDEFRMVLYPVSLGGGKKLFPDGTRVNLRLLNSKTLSNGVVLLHYATERN